MPQRNRNQNRRRPGNRPGRRASGNRPGGANRGKAFFTKPLTRKRAVRQAKLASRLATRPERRAIKGEIRAEKVLQSRIPDYFKQYQQAVSGAADKTAAAYGEAAKSIGASSSSAAAYAEALRQRLAGEETTDEEIRGATVGTGGSDLSKASQEARINAANVLTGVLAGQGASQAGYYADKARIGSREQVEQMLRSAARQRGVRKDLRVLGREAGDIRRQELADLRDRERDYRLGLKAAREPGKARRHSARQAGLERAFESSEAAKARRNARREAARERRTDRRTSTSSGGGGGSARRDIGAAIREAQGEIENAVPTRVDKKKNPELYARYGETIDAGEALDFLRSNRRRALNAVTDEVSAQQARKAFRRAMAQYRRARDRGRTPGELGSTTR